MKRWLVFIILSVGFFCAPVSAQETQYKDTTEYSFDDDVVIGDLVRPDDQNVVVRQRGKERSLIQVRTNFIPELLKSVEDL